jgi:alkylation response protein AidB-like acyl-CoA dehydrogenase
VPRRGAQKPVRAGIGHGPASVLTQLTLGATIEASWAAANTCLDTHGGYGFVDAYDVERKFRETRLYKVAPVTNNLITSFIATKVLGLPRSY